MATFLPAQTFVACHVRVSNWATFSDNVDPVWQEVLLDESPGLNWTTDNGFSWPYYITFPVTGIYEIWAKIYGNFLDATELADSLYETVAGRILVFNLVPSVETENPGDMMFDDGSIVKNWFAFPSTMHYTMKCAAGTNAIIECPYDPGWTFLEDHESRIWAEMFAYLVGFEDGAVEDEWT